MKQLTAAIYSPFKSLFGSYVLSVFLSLGALNASSQRASPPNHSEGFSEYFAEYIDISSGLSNNYVAEIVQDQFGMMWFACEGGVNRYDGDHFKMLRPDDRYGDQLLNENIESLFIDSKNSIWVGTKSGGVSRYDQAVDQFVNLNHVIKGDRDIPTIRITDVAEDSEGNIWIGTWRMGFYMLSGRDYSLLRSFETGRTIQDIEVDKFGNVWAASNNTLHKFDPSEQRLINFDVPVGVTNALFYDSLTDKLLIGSFDGLFTFDIANYQLERFAGDKAQSLVGVSSLNIDKKGRIWVGSWNMGLHVSSTDRKSFRKYNLLPPGQKNTNYEVVLDIHIDKSDQLWIGTGYGGVVRLSPSRAINYVANAFDQDINLPDNNVQAIYKDTQGRLWCGTWNGGVGIAGDGIHFESLPGSSLGKVTAFLQVGDTMMVGTSQGLLYYDVQKPAKGPIHKVLPRRKIRELLLDTKDRLWVGTQEAGMFLVDFKKNKGISEWINFQSDASYNNSLNSDRISKVVEDDHGIIWVGTYNGLYVFHETDSTFLRIDDREKGALPSVIFLSLLFESPEILWIAMPGGLVKASVENQNLEILKIFRREQGLKNDYITGITNDANGNLWLSNTSGIATVQKDSEAVINMPSSTEYQYAMNINAYYKGTDNIYFGSSNGFFFFDPMQVDLIESSPELIFNSLKIDNVEVGIGDEVNGRVVLQQSMPYTDQLRITHMESVVSIGFVPANFQDRANLRFFYRIRGLQDNWIDNGKSSEINFIGLDAGNYTLEVKSTRDRINFGEIKRMELIVSPAPWLSPYAYTVYALIALVLAIIINQFFVNRAKLQGNLAMAKLATEKEHELNEAKLRFFTNISHELRTPLTLIISPIAEIIRNAKLKPEIKQRLSYVETNAHRLLDLINQLLDFRKAEQGELKLKVATGNFVQFANEIFLSFKGYSETEGVVYDFQSSSNFIELTYDRDKMEILLCNLLSNAFKFTKQKGRITMTITENEESCLIEVKDSGKGMSREAQEKIFNRFFQIQDSESAKVIGSGIGLSLSQRIAELHQGKIEVVSGLGKGSKFMVTIPKGKDHFEHINLIEDFQSSENIEVYGQVSGTEKEAVSQLEDPTMKLLIIDDNPDILSYLKTLFEEAGYLVQTATQGREGKEVAFEVIPDLIISDIMMPEMDGIELCAILKNDIQTSHIPVILLTARTSTVYEVDGLETGADDYVRKPFDPDVIKSRVATLLENRQKVRAHFINQVRFDSKKGLKPVNREEKFIQDLSKRIEASILDENFNIDLLADQLCMSQSTLYRKVKSLTGMSIVGFIRSIRLRKSTEILITEDIKLSAVAYSVGFNDYKYFKKSFTQQYGISPKEYREKAFKEVE